MRRDRISLRDLSLFFSLSLSLLSLETALLRYTHNDDNDDDDGKIRSGEGSRRGGKTRPFFFPSIHPPIFPALSSDEYNQTSRTCIFGISRMLTRSIFVQQWKSVAALVVERGWWWWWWWLGFKYRAASMLGDHRRIIPPRRRKSRRIFRTGKSKLYRSIQRFSRIPENLSYYLFRKARRKRGKNTFSLRKRGGWRGVEKVGYRTVTSVERWLLWKRQRGNNGKQSSWRRITTVNR